MKGLATTLGCRVEHLPTIHLGLPLGAPFKAVRAWDGMEEDSKKGSPCGRGNFFPKQGDSP